VDSLDSARRRLRLTKFDEIQRDLGVATNVLTDRLGTLVEHGCCPASRTSSGPLRYRYELTDKGAELLPGTAVPDDSGATAGRPKPAGLR